MRRSLIAFTLLSLPLMSYADCWIISGLKGKASFSQDEYEFIDDQITGAAFKMIINDDKASVTTLSGEPLSDMRYVPLSSNTIVGSYQAGGGITVETWSVTTDKKVMYTKVMNIPAFQQITSTKSFIGDIAGKCDK
ncbi:hypothetical protein [Enterobacter sp. CP102]|uniref:hypothetical protein n=1 Tax=Enterobacter sp. CP102 TaxID=2976431 RepID=UPI002202D748|nr:hypothetical protein [Enterobacter sp. CP102]UWM65084.1 hypothetical protein N1249_04455 [Enterobacter sp. CP102]